MPDIPRAVKADLDHRFDHHPPLTDTVVKAHEAARAAIKRAATTLVRVVPTGRDHSLMLTHLEEALMRANSAIAKHHPDNQKDAAR